MNEYNSAFRAGKEGNMLSLEAARNKTSSKFQQIQQNNGPAVTPYAIALYSFKGNFDDELTFEANDIVLLIQHIDENWIEGEIDGKVGIFPANYVTVEVDCPYHGFKANSATIGKSSFDSFSCNHLDTLKEPSISPVVADWSVFQTTSEQATNSWPVSSPSNNLTNTAHIKPHESNRAQRNIKTSETLDTYVENSSNFENTFLKRKVCKSFSFPGDATDNESKCNRKSFVLKQKQAPQPPRRPRAAPIPSTIPLLPLTADISKVPDRPVLPMPQFSINTTANCSSLKSDTDKLFGNLVSDEFSMFERPDGDAQIISTTNRRVHVAKGKLTSDAMSAGNHSTVLGVNSHMDTEIVPTKCEEKDNKLADAVV